jgi:hypothetical protein
MEVLTEHPASEQLQEIMDRQVFRETQVRMEIQEQRELLVILEREPQTEILDRGMLQILGPTKMVLMGQQEILEMREHQVIQVQQELPRHLEQQIFLEVLEETVEQEGMLVMLVMPE